MGVCEALCDMLACKKGYTNTFLCFCVPICAVSCVVLCLGDEVDVVGCSSSPCRFSASMEDCHPQ